MPFKVLTFMGEEEFFLILLPLIYWCLDHRTGARLIVLFLFSAYVNAVAKVLAGQPRPFEYNLPVQQLYEASGGGLPSGHTQGTVVVWCYLASQFRRAWLWVVAALLLLYLWLEPRAAGWLAERSLAWQLGVAVVVPALMMLLFRTENGVTSGATLMGMGAGFALERRWVGFESSEVWWKRALRFPLGVVILVGLYMGLGRKLEVGLVPRDD